RNSNGKLLRKTNQFTYGQRAFPEPIFPTAMPPSSAPASGTPGFFTTGSVDGGSLRYRVLVQRVGLSNGQQDLLVVAIPLTELGMALNAMLAQIEEAFAERKASEDRLRRFLADACHELRTPLTPIRGYAELFRRGAGKRQADLAKSMRRIEDESTRMGLMVED